MTATTRDPIVKEVEPQGAVGGVGPVELVGSTANPRSGFPADSVVLVSVLTLAILCLAIGAIPWALVSWRMSHYVTPRQIDLTLVGLGLLVAAALTFYVTGGL